LPGEKRRPFSNTADPAKTKGGPGKGQEGGQRASTPMFEGNRKKTLRRTVYIPITIRKGPEGKKE